MALFTLANWPLSVRLRGDDRRRRHRRLETQGAQLADVSADRSAAGLLGLLHTFGLAARHRRAAASAPPWPAPRSAFVLLLPVYAIGGMGAGDVKMQMGFGSWIGAFFGLGRRVAPRRPGRHLVGLRRGRDHRRRHGPGHDHRPPPVPHQPRQHPRDRRRLARPKGVGEVAGKAAPRKPRMHLLPYGIPLCLGFVGYLVYLHGWAVRACLLSRPRRLEVRPSAWLESPDDNR